MNCHRYKEEKAKVVKISENVSNFKVGQSFFLFAFFLFVCFFLWERYGSKVKRSIELFDLCARDALKGR